MDLLEEIRKSCTTPGLAKIRNIVICTHAKASVIKLCKVLLKDGVRITFYPVPYSKETKNLEKLLALGVEVIELPEKLIPRIIEADAAIEDGARISKLISNEKIKLKSGFFTVEQTSGGVRYFEDNPPRYPVINVALSPMKLDVENRRATPEGVIRYFSEATGKLLGAKEVLVIGFGSIGEGIARLAQTLGAHVTIYDSMATKRMFAQHHGYATVEHDQLAHLLSKIDVIFMATNTYQGTTLGIEQVALMKDGAIVCNAGSGRGELATALQKPGTYRAHDAKLTISENGQHLKLSLKKADLSKEITILAKGFPINLHIGKGTSHDAIEIVMSLMLAGLVTGPTSKEAGLQQLDLALQECVAACFLRRKVRRQSFAPRYVKSRQIKVNERAYGGVYPFHNDLSHTANMSVVRAWFKSGSKTRGHYHCRSQESYYAEKGTADIIVWPADNTSAQESFSMETGDYLLVPENHFHDVKVTSKEDFECLVIATPPFTPWDQFFASEKEK